MTWLWFVALWVALVLIVLALFKVADRLRTPTIKVPRDAEFVTVATTGPFRPGSVARINGEDFLVLAILDLHHMLVTREVQGAEVRDD